jgi:hypothetical protein
MTDVSLLGAVQSPPDNRDYQFASLLTPEEAAVALPGYYQANPVPPRIAQVGGTCTAASSTYMRMYQQKLDLGAWLKLDYQWLYAEEKKIDGIQGEGSTVRAAMTILKNKGQAIVGNAAAAVKNRISAYYAIPINVESLKRAIFTYGGIVVAAPWANSYFKPGANGVLPKPDTLAGGHAFYVVGWNDTLKVFICINSWSLPWGYQGRGVFFLPYSVVSDPNWGLWEAWKAVDLPHN